jgi:hypothetical protein
MNQTLPPKGPLQTIPHNGTFSDSLPTFLYARRFKYTTHPDMSIHQCIPTLVYHGESKVPSTK